MLHARVNDVCDLQLVSIKDHNSGARNAEDASEVKANSGSSKLPETSRNRSGILQVPQDELQSDIYSEEECITLAHSLNSSIQRVSASIVNACWTSHTTQNFLKEDIASIQSLIPKIGEWTFNFLFDVKNLHWHGYAYVMQCAIQATLAALCEQIISLWSFNKEEHTTLLSIYTSMRENMNKTITPVLTGTWRALTRTHTKIPAYHPLRSVALQSFAEETAKILVLCRSPWTLDDAQGIVRDYFSTELSDLYDCCFRLDRVAYEGIGSFDVEVFLNKPGDIYEAECMYEVEAGSDMEKDQQNGKSTEIAFSCRLGLYKVESRSGAPPGSALQEVILLKAGIHLTSLFSTFESTA